MNTVWHKRFWRWRFLRWVGGIVGVLLVAVVLLVIFFDWNWLKPPLEARLSAVTGKQVHIDGAVTGSMSWVPHIAIHQIRIEQPDFAAAPRLGVIDSVTVDIDLRRLLAGKLDFPEIDVAKPVLNLYRTADGKANWEMPQAGASPERGSFPLIGKLNITNGTLTYDDRQKHSKLTATIATIGAAGGEGDGAVTLTGHGVYGDAPFSIKLKGGSLNDLRDTQKPYDIDAAAAVGNTKLSIVGTVTDPFKLTDMLLKLTADGDNAARLYPLFGLPAPSTPPYHLTGTLDRDGKAWLFKNFSGTVGKSDLEGSLRLDPDRPRPLVSGNLLSHSLDFADLGLLVGAAGSTAAGRPVSDDQRRIAEASAKSDRILPDAPLNLNEVRNIDADVTFKGEHIQAQSLPLEAADMHVKLDNALLSLDPLRIGVAGGLIDAAIVINARGDAVQTDYDVRFHRFQLDQFFRSAGLPQGGSGFIDGRIRLHGTGDSVRSSLGSSNGQASAIVDKGTISNLAANILGLDVARALGVLISGDQQIPLRCMVADFQVENGTMRPRAFVLDTDSTLVTATGSIDLTNEHLDLKIDGDPKHSTPLALGGPIEVGGTFKTPSVGLGAEAIARGGAAVTLGVLLTPLAAILGFIDPGQGQDVDCAGIEQRAQTNSARAPKPARH